MDLALPTKVPRPELSTESTALRSITICRAPPAMDDCIASPTALAEYTLIDPFTRISVADSRVLVVIFRVLLPLD